MRKVLLAGLALALLAGCSSATKDAGIPTVPFSTEPATVAAQAITPSLTPSPTPTLWTVAEAQANYLAYVAPGNADIDTLNSLSKSPTLAKLKPICAKITADDDTLARQVSAGLWPVSAQAQSAALVAGITKDRLSYQGCSTATTLSGAIAAVNSDPGEGSSAAEAMRIALGLPGTS